MKISTIRRISLQFSKPGRVLTYKSRFNTKTHEFSPTSCLLSVLLVTFSGRTGKSCYPFFCFKRVWPRLELLIWYVVCFQAMYFRDKQWWWIEVKSSRNFLFSNYKHYISTNTMPMATEFGRVVIYYKWLLPIKLHFLFITWCLEITRQTKTIIFQLPQCPWPPNLAGW